MPNRTPSETTGIVLARAILLAQPAVCDLEAELAQEVEAQARLVARYFTTLKDQGLSPADAFQAAFSFQTANSKEKFWLRKVTEHPAS